MKTIQIWQQEKMHPQHEVAIQYNGIVTVDGIPANGEREQALGNIILRLNAQIIILSKQLQSKE